MSKQWCNNGTFHLYTVAFIASVTGLALAVVRHPGVIAHSFITAAVFFCGALVYIWNEASCIQFIMTVSKTKHAYSGTSTLEYLH